MSDLINDCCNDDADADAVKEVNVTEVATKKREVKQYDPAKLSVDLIRNPRFAERYESENAECEKMARSIHKYGLQSPLVINLRNGTDPWVLQGHRRRAAIMLIRTKGIPAGKGKDGLEAIPADPNFLPKVDCIVYKGLTLVEEMDLVMDHGTVLLLNDQEKILAAQRMTSVGFTHAMTADKLGMSRSNYTNGIGKLLQLPQFIVDAALERDSEKLKNLPKMTQPVIKELHAIYAEEQKVRGAKVRVAGEKLLAGWEKVVKDGANDPIRVLSKEKIKALFTGLSPATDQDIIDLLQAILDGNAQDAGSAVNRLKISLQMAGDTVGTDRKTIEEGIIKPVVNQEFTEMKAIAGQVS